MSSREVYLLLLHFASSFDGRGEPDGWAKQMQALALVIHWFAVDRARVVNWVFESCHEELSIGNIRKALRKAVAERKLHLIHSPDEFDAFVRVPSSNDAFPQWSWSGLISVDGATEAIELRRVQWQGFLGLRFNRELLLYVQRTFLADRFPDYDPSRRDLWEEHNRPWDFDHILATYYFYNRKDRGDFREVCGEWGYTIANLRAWPAEANRSDQALTAEKKIGDANAREHSFLTEDEVDAFSKGDDTRLVIHAARGFADQCRERLLRIYRNWYETVGVADLQTEEPSAGTRTGSA